MKTKKFKKPKDNPRLEALLDGESFIRDHSAYIGQAMGGEQWRQEMGIIHIHRVGLKEGMAWEFPAVKGDITYAKVQVESNGKYFMGLGTGPDNIRFSANGLSLSDLRPTFDLAVSQ